MSSDFLNKEEIIEIFRLQGALGDNKKKKKDVVSQIAKVQGNRYWIRNTDCKEDD